MSKPGLEADDLTLPLGSFALQNVSLAADAGEILVMLGPNGAGKSVCLEAIAGFHRLLRGRIRINGRDVTALPPERRRTGFVVQNFGLFPHLSVAENVAIGERDEGAAGNAESLLARFGIAHLATARPLDLSPGEKQRAALARALASRADVFLFDEPFAALDAVTAESLRGELASFLRSAGIPAIFVTHDRSEARALADRIAIIDAGVIRQDGRAEDVFERPATVAIARFLGIENLLDARVAAIDGDKVGLSIAGQSLIATRPAPALTLGQAISLCIRAEHVYLAPSEASRQSNCLRAQVAGLTRSGPLWKLSLTCGFRLIAYALPQTVETCALAPGAAIDVAIDPAAIHLIAGD